MRTWVLLALILTLATPAGAAKVTVEHDVGVDFAKYKTYAWREGTEAGQPDVQSAIVKYVELELRALGLTKVSASQADLFVMTNAVSVGSARATGGYTYLQNHHIGVLTQDFMVKMKAFLAVDLIDAKTDKPVWRGLASDVLGIPKPAKLRKKVENVLRKMFKEFPER